MLSLMHGNGQIKSTAINSVIRFKKGVYASIFSEFADVLKGLKNN